MPSIRQAARATAVTLLSMGAGAVTVVLASVLACGHWWLGARVLLADFTLAGSAVIVFRRWLACSPRHQAMRDDGGEP